MAAIPTALPGVVVLKEQWTQCENDNCSKWRKLPPGTVVDEDASWYCYMNPDPRRNRCSASEEEYDEKTEIVLDGDLDDEEALHNQLIKRHLEASMAAAAALGAAAGGAARGRDRGRGGTGGAKKGKAGGKGRGRGSGGSRAASGRGDALSHGYYSQQQPSLQSKRRRNDLDDDAGSPVGTAMPPAAPTIPTRARRQQAAHLLRALENHGSWEGGAAPGTLPPYAPPPAAVWEALSQQTPELAEVACQAADVASSARYFEDAPGGKASVEEASLIARLALMLSSACALAGAKDTLTPQEQTRAGLASGPPAQGGLPMQQPSGTESHGLANGGLAMQSGNGPAGVLPSHQQQQQPHQQQQPAAGPAGMNGRQPSFAAGGSALQAAQPLAPLGVRQQSPGVQPGGVAPGQRPAMLPQHLQPEQAQQLVGGLGNLSAQQLQMMQQLLMPQLAAGGVPAQQPQQRPLPVGGALPSAAGLPQPPRGTGYPSASVPWPLQGHAAAMPLGQPLSSMPPPWPLPGQQRPLHQLAGPAAGPSSAGLPGGGGGAWQPGRLVGGASPVQFGQGMGAAQQQ